MKKTVPNYIKILGWIISFSAFTLGFWHTHLGLREFRALSSNYGSIVIALIIVLVLIVAYNRAINGVRSGMYFYLLCALFMFIFNLNSFYPSYLGRKLIKEEAIHLNDTLQSYNAKLTGMMAETYSDIFRDIEYLNQTKNSVLQEIMERGGFGTEATKRLNEFNAKAGTVISPDRDIKSTMPERENRRDYFESEMNAAIDNYIVKAATKTDKNAIQIYTASKKMDSLTKEYSPRLELIIKDNSRIDKIDSIRFFPEVITLSELVTNIDNIGKEVSTATTNKLTFPKLRNEEAQVPLPKTQELGRLAHTLNSAWERIGKLDTWGIIILCLFIDFVVPLAIFFLIRSDLSDAPNTPRIKGPKTF
jgi:hypothetical protein